MSQARPKITHAAALLGFVLCVIILPFVLFGAQIEDAAVLWSEGAQPGALGIGVIALLALDILLPVPSSVVSLLAGKTLGVVPASVAIWVGMTLGCYVGVLVARGVLSPVAGFLQIDVPDAHDPSANVQRWGWVSLVLMRPVPVLAEASVLYAAVSGYPTWRLMLATSVANVPIAVLYAYAGARLLGDVPMWIMFAALAVFSAPALLRPLLFRNTAPK